MSFIGNCLIRGVLNKQLYPALRLQSSARQIKVSLFYKSNNWQCKYHT